MTRNRSRLTRKKVDALFPHQVEIPIPVGGLGQKLTDMHSWCASQNLDYETIGAGGFPRETVRFCFRDRASAEAFRSANLTVRES